MKYEQKLAMVPVWEKSTLTLDEASAYSGLGRNKLIELLNDPDCEFGLWNGQKRLVKRKKLDDYLNRSFSI
ncbi:transposase [Pseudoflavonifractor sp. An44]|uniref:excisionase n=1 Tax=Pseudoflavonifractor sp. An44 TaxID=1965635 RepID=UPI000B3AA5C9|nr:excisionase [Pseudoflavonifractor sp. An44]OUN99622.1 transposase [Pseudoflavonifractor sp. An44]